MESRELRKFTPAGRSGGAVRRVRRKPSRPPSWKKARRMRYAFCTAVETAGLTRTFGSRGDPSSFRIPASDSR